MPRALCHGTPSRHHVLPHLGHAPAAIGNPVLGERGGVREMGRECWAGPELSLESLESPTGTRRRLFLQGLRRLSTLAAVLVLQDASRSEARPFEARAADLSFVGSEVPPALAAIFSAYVADIRSALGPSFNARLAIYGVTPRLPSGIPGDPARDYSSNRRNCGEFRKPGGFPPVEPYAICDDVTCTSEDKTTCCRHYAYCVPYDNFPANELDAVSTVMVSSRIVNLPETTIRGILAHELGHAVDFHVFGKRYRLRNKPVEVSSGELESRLLEINATVGDVEFRADDLANLLVLEGAGQRLCYDRGTRLQRLRPLGGSCDGDDDDEHYGHPVLRRPIL